MPASPEIEPQRTAFLLDFDGTLVAIAPRPDMVELAPRVGRALERLRSKSGGALAIVTGRALEDLDRLLHPLVLPAAGVHGLELRGPDGVLRRGGFDHGALARMTDATVVFASHHPGLLAERKPGSVALHYRGNPEMEADCLIFAERLAAAVGGVTPMRGKMVVELRLGGHTKADAVSGLMALPPLKGRMPLFAGDDVTDEDAFRRTRELGGVGIKVGPGKTAAQLRAPDIGRFHDWLEALGEGTDAGCFLEPAHAGGPDGPAGDAGPDLAPRSAGGAGQ